MALSKTFSEGQVLTAQDVNAHLAHHVPNPGDPYDTGWLDIVTQQNFTASAAAVRRIGMTLYFKGRITGTFSANTNTSIGTTPIRPAAASSVAAATAAGHGDIWLRANTNRSILARSPRAGSASVELASLSGILAGQ